MAEIIKFKARTKQHPKQPQPTTQLTCFPVYHPEVSEPIVTSLDDLGTAMAIAVTVTGDNNVAEKLATIARRAFYDDDKDSWVELTLEESRQFADYLTSLEPDRYLRLKVLKDKYKYAFLLSEGTEEERERYEKTYSSLDEFM